MESEDANFHYFTARPLKYLAPVDELESFAPIVDAQVLNLTEDETPQIYALCGRGATSSMKIMRPGMEVSELVVYPLPGNPYAVWTVKARKTGKFSCWAIGLFALLKNDRSCSDRILLSISFELSTNI